MRRTSIDGGVMFVYVFSRAYSTAPIIGSPRSTANHRKLKCLTYILYILVCNNIFNRNDSFGTTSCAQSLVYIFWILCTHTNSSAQPPTAEREFPKKKKQRQSERAQKCMDMTRKKNRRLNKIYFAYVTFTINHKFNQKFEIMPKWMNGGRNT